MVTVKHKNTVRRGLDISVLHSYVLMPLTSVQFSPLTDWVVGGT